MPQKVKRRIRLKKTPLLIIFLLILVVIGTLVSIFISFYKAEKNAPPNVGLVGLPPVHVSSVMPVPAESIKEPTSSASSASSVIPDDMKSTKEVKVETIVPQTVPVDDLYFKDALFIGDSISKGFKLWVSKYPNNVIADQNVGLDQIYNNKDVYYINSSKKTTLWNAIEQKIPNPKKIYVLLGTNGIPGFENNKHIVFYRDLIDKLQKKFPDAIIYIESLTPITKEVSKRRSPNFTTEKINGFNKLVLEMATEKKIYYLQIEDTLKDKNGYMKSEYDAGDGTHMLKEGHAAVYSYLKKHTVSEDGFATVYETD